MTTGVLSGPRVRPPPTPIIYALCDPRGDQPIRYIGLSKNGLKRPKEHLRPGCIDRNENPHLSRWLRQLFALNLKPSIEILEEVEQVKDLPEAEIFHIAYWRSLGFKLVNMTDGGNQPPVMQWTPEMRALRSKLYAGRPAPWLKGKPRSIESRQKQSAATKGVKKAPRSEQHTINNAIAQGGRPFTDGESIFWTKKQAATKLGICQYTVKASLTGKHKSKVQLWYCDAIPSKEQP